MNPTSKSDSVAISANRLSSTGLPNAAEPYRRQALSWLIYAYPSYRPEDKVGT